MRPPSLMCSSLRTTVLSGSSGDSDMDNTRGRLHECPPLARCAVPPLSANLRDFLAAYGRVAPSVRLFAGVSPWSEKSTTSRGSPWRLLSRVQCDAVLLPER